MKSKENRRIFKSKQIEAEDRRLRSLRTEQYELWRQLRDAPLRELEKPFQRGWVRSFVLREDARRRKDGEQLAQALALVESVQWCRVFPFREYDRTRKKFVYWRHKLAYLTSSDVKSVRVDTELLKYFEMRRGRPLTRSRVKGILQNGWGGELRFRYPEYAVSDTQPYIVTHETVALPDVERRLAEVDEQLGDPSKQGRLWNLQGYSQKKWQRCEEEREYRRLERRMIHEVRDAVDEFYHQEGDFQLGHFLQVPLLEAFFLN